MGRLASSGHSLSRACRRSCHGCSKSGNVALWAVFSLVVLRTVCTNLTGLHITKACLMPDEVLARVPRRQLLQLGTAGVAYNAVHNPAAAFDNRIGPAVASKSKYKRMFEDEEGKPRSLPDSMKKRGDIMDCPVGVSNCLSTNSLRKTGAKIKPWMFKGKASADDAMRELREVVDAYPPGQSGIDGGGFKVIQAFNNYLYVQYESLKFGYIDDLEFLLLPAEGSSGTSGQVNVHSGSRVGEADFGVNAIRLNRLAEDLRVKGGWEITSVTQETNPRYWEPNCKTEGTFLPSCSIGTLLNGGNLNQLGIR